MVAISVCRAAAPFVSVSETEEKYSCVLDIQSQLQVHAIGILMCYREPPFACQDYRRHLFRVQRYATAFNGSRSFLNPSMID